MEKTNEYGKIKFSDNAFEKLIKDALTVADGRESLAVERKNIIISEDDHEIQLEFHVVHKFGSSMLYATRTIMDYIEENLKPLKLGKPVRVTMKIVAIKAKKSFKVNHENMRIIS